MRLDVFMPHQSVNHSIYQQLHTGSGSPVLEFTVTTAVVEEGVRETG